MIDPVRLLMIFPSTFLTGSLYSLQIIDCKSSVNQLSLVERLTDLEY